MKRPRLGCQLTAQAWAEVDNSHVEHAITPEDLKPGSKTDQVWHMSLRHHFCLCFYSTIKLQTVNPTILAPVADHHVVSQHARTHGHTHKHAQRHTQACTHTHTHTQTHTHTHTHTPFNVTLFFSDCLWNCPVHIERTHLTTTATLLLIAIKVWLSALWTIFHATNTCPFTLAYFV